MTKLEELYVKAVKAHYAAEAAAAFSDAKAYAARKDEDDAWVSYCEELKKQEENSDDH
jgi:ribosomal protein L12E/L44/L45/RPP1/RPP2